MTNKRVRRVRFRATVAMLATIGTVLGAAAPAFAGSYSYRITEERNYWYTRNVNHDYSRLNAWTFNGATTCIRRSTGIAFCANWEVAHSYTDSCNPSACIGSSQWYGGPGISAPISVGHTDEWR